MRSATPIRIGAVALEIARQIRNQYTIAYAPLNQAMDGTYRAIRVTVSAPERLSVRPAPDIARRRSRSRTGMPRQS